jgi:hypothetical protein
MISELGFRIYKTLQLRGTEAIIRFAMQLCLPMIATLSLVNNKDARHRVFIYPENSKIL